MTSQSDIMFKTKIKNINITGGQMNNDINHPKLPTLIDSFMANSKQYIDNIFADNWKELKISSVLKQSGFKKRTGCSIDEVERGRTKLTK